MNLGDNVLEIKVKEKSNTLFNQRMNDMSTFWSRNSEEKRQFLLGTSLLMDGNLHLGIELYNRTELTFNKRYNILSAYKLFNQLDKYHTFKTELMNHHEEDFHRIESKTHNKKIAYFLAYLGNTGAMKMLLLHKEWLEEAGYSVDFYVPYSTKGLKYASTLFSKEIQVHTYCADKDLRKISSKYDIAFAPHWDHLYPLQQYFKKVFYFSQGDYDIFSEEPNVIKIMQQAYWMPTHIFTVSSFLKEHIQRKTFREPLIIPCGIDTNHFKPGDKFKKKTILVVGSATIQQKKIAEVLSHMLLLKRQHDMDIIWVNPMDNPETLEGIRVINNPEKDELAELYKKSHIFVSGSEIESFSLPPLEAMASGTAVVAADNGGILEYGVHDENVLLFKPNNWDDMNRYVTELLVNEDKRNQLAASGITTAQKYQSYRIKEQFIQYVNQCMSSTFFYQP